MDYSSIINGILEVVEREEPVLLGLDEEVISTRFNNQKRSIKMLVGHLVDSANNNQQRMVRLQYAPRCGWSMPDANVGMLVFPDYTQDNDLWIALQDYQHYDWKALVELWKCVNLHIVHIIQSVDQSKLGNYWLDYQGNRCTLDGMIRGYLDHLNLHIGQIHELMG